MEITSNAFREKASQALQDADLQDALQNLKRGFQEKRAKTLAHLPEYEALREEAIAVKDHVLRHLDFYLNHFEEKVRANGGHVHWCETAADARATILRLCQQAGAKTVVKGKSMIAEEIAINDHLAAHGIAPVETDLGEYIIQLRKEPPSHIIAPAIHLKRDQIAGTFRRQHQDLPDDRALDTPRRLVDEARHILRERFLGADAALTGANFLIAETGSAVLVSNEGNIDLSRGLAGLHIVLASLEKVVPSLNDAFLFLRLLSRAATGQEAATYTSFFTGPSRPGEVDGPGAFHVVLLDNGRSKLLGGEFAAILRCIRCGACLNHCPVYGVTGGHAYGAVYTGPMGAVLTPLLEGLDRAGPLPEASTFCGRCEEVCPMGIPLVGLLRKLRVRRRAEGRVSPLARAGLGVWAFLARRPFLYHAAARALVAVLFLFRRRGRVPAAPFAGGWGRSLPLASARTFQAEWRRRQGEDA